MASLFDLRVVIGGLLALYGLTLTVMGLFASPDTKTKAAGITSTSGPAWSSWPAARSSWPGPGSAPCSPRTSKTPTPTAPTSKRAASLLTAVDRASGPVAAAAHGAGVCSAPSRCCRSWSSGGSAGCCSRADPPLRPDHSVRDAAAAADRLRLRPGSGPGPARSRGRRRSWSSGRRSAAGRRPHLGPGSPTSIASPPTPSRTRTVTVPDPCSVAFPTSTSTALTRATGAAAATSAH
jgi:hypothetical protein